MESVKHEKKVKNVSEAQHTYAVAALERSAGKHVCTMIATAVSHHTHFIIIPLHVLVARAIQSHHAFHAWLILCMVPYSV